MEEIAKIVTINISHAVEILAAIIIGIAVIKVVSSYIIKVGNLQRGATTRMPKNDWKSSEEIRIGFGRSVAVSLELLLGADVLATAVAPSWDAIGKLAAIAILRTALNFFLGKELKEMKTRD